MSARGAFSAIGFAGRFLFALFVEGILTLGLVFAVYLGWSLSFDLRQVGHIPERCWVYDVDGNVYSRLYGENRILVNANQVSPLFKKALLAREDSRFYENHGIDLVGISRAFTRDMSHFRLLQGGSTITQQLARNSFDLGKRDLSRKILEAFMAVRIDLTFSKDQILDYYINRIYFGSGYYGLETAARAYFGKSAAQVNLAEAATLAGLIRSPNRYSPINNPTGAVAQRNEVLDRMAELGYISSSEEETAKSTPLKTTGKKSPVPQQNYAKDAIYHELQGIVSQDEIDGGGLKIYTTLDPTLQLAADSALDSYLTQLEAKSDYKHPRKSAYSESDRTNEEGTPYLQGAALVIDNHTGGIRAIVGGRDYQDSKFNRALQAVRSVGSIAKPFIYAAAYESGWFPGTQISDDPIRPGEVPEAPHWNPGNSDSSSRGMLALRDGLIFSRNTMTVRVGEHVGLGKVQAMLTEAGLGNNIPKLPSIYLGTFGSTLKDITAAYTAFPSGGVRREPYLIERIDDKEGHVLYQAHPLQRQILKPSIAWMVAETLEGVLSRGTAASAKSLGLDRTAAGKTGTTDDYKDAWFVGFTNSLTCGVWVGFDQPQTIEQRGYGAALALPIWVKIIERASRTKYPDGDFAPPEPLARVELCSVSNELATDACRSAGTAYQITLPQSVVPSQTCQVHHGEPVNPNAQPADNQNNLRQRFLDSVKKLFGG
jgi:penicillin-binding protein 1A